MTAACVGIGIITESRIAFGEAYLLCQGPVCITPSWVEADNIENEVQRFLAAVKEAAQQLNLIRKDIPSNTPEEITEFIDTHLLMLEDKAISEQPVHYIREKKLTAEWALQIHRDNLVKLFDQMNDPYLRTRKDDLDHVVNRIQKILIANLDEVEDTYSGKIVLADELSPADLIAMKQRGLSGFVTENGSPMSHTAILARSLDIPAVVGAHGVTRCFRHAEALVLDTTNGTVLADCNEREVERFKELQKKESNRLQELRHGSQKPANTLDEISIHVMANIEFTEDVGPAIANGAAGVGLYRTEFLYMNRSDIPSEEEHLENYLDVIEGMVGRPITIRTLDLGADKQAQVVSSRCVNPALGLRAIRLCLKEPELFMPQVRAILRASAHGSVRLMLPMITNAWEVNQALKLIRKARLQLDQKGEAYDPEMPIGGMIEVPAAALNADELAAQLDFLSIGTNDLIQYTLAIDRLDDEVSYLYDPLHPSVLQLIQMTIDAGMRHGTPVGMCGEMAGELRYIPMLLGMGLREFSMQPLALLDAKDLVRRVNTQELSDLVTQWRSNMSDIDPHQLIKSFPIH